MATATGLQGRLSHESTTEGPNTSSPSTYETSPERASDVGTRAPQSEPGVSTAASWSDGNSDAPTSCTSHDDCEADEVCVDSSTRTDCGRGLHADVKIALDADADSALRTQFDQGVDVVLDFLWGEPAARILRAATKDRGSRTGEPRLRFVQLGTAAGLETTLLGDMLRSTGLELIGSGIGSVAIQELIAGAGELLTVARSAGFTAPFEAVSLSAVTSVWNEETQERRLLLPNGV